jgi:hypothetical protein
MARGWSKDVFCFGSTLEVFGGLGPLSPQKLAHEVRLSLTLIN